MNTVIGGSPIDLYVHGGAKAIEFTKTMGELATSAVWQVKIAVEDLTAYSTLHIPIGETALGGGIPGLASHMFGACAEILQSEYRKAPEFIGQAFRLAGRTTGATFETGYFVFNMVVYPRSI